MRLGLFLSTLALTALAGCQMPANGPSSPVAPNVIGAAPAAPGPGTFPTSMPSTPVAPVTGSAITPMTAPVRVAILVPQSGPNAAIGQALSQAAQLAVFDLNENNFQLIPKDTGATPDGARAAVQAAASEGVQLILGPLFAQEVAAAKDAARAYNIPVIEFSTDWRLAGDNVYSMGVLPFGQAQRVASYAAAQGLRRIGIIATGDVYGDAVVNEFQNAAQPYGMSIVKVTRLNADGTDAPQAAQKMTGGQALSANRMPYDALFMPVGGSALHNLVASLKSYGITSANVRFLGTGLWDDASVMHDPAMAGAVYAAPSPQLRTNFERNYQRIYGSMPPRLASIGYDSAALAIVLARNAMAAGRPVDYSRAAISDPNGFSGVDGIFRFSQQGLAERGMAVLQIGGGAVHVADPAPTTFQ